MRGEYILLVAAGIIIVSVLIGCVAGRHVGSFLLNVSGGTDRYQVDMILPLLHRSFIESLGFVSAESPPEGVTRSYDPRTDLHSIVYDTYRLEGLCTLSGQYSMKVSGALFYHQATLQFSPEEGPSCTVQLTMNLKYEPYGRVTHTVQRFTIDEVEQEPELLVDCRVGILPGTVPLDQKGRLRMRLGRDDKEEGR